MKKTFLYMAFTVIAFIVGLFFMMRLQEDRFGPESGVVTGKIVQISGGKYNQFEPILGVTFDSGYVSDVRVDSTTFTRYDIGDRITFSNIDRWVVFQNDPPFFKSLFFFLLTGVSLVAFVVQIVLAILDNIPTGKD